MSGQGFTTSPSTTKVCNPASRIMVVLRAASLLSDDVITPHSPAPRQSVGPKVKVG
jgi:hypothetical protein